MIRLDAVSVLMLGMISLLAAVIVRYSNSYLDGDDRHGVFLGWLATTIAAVEVLVLAGGLGLLVVAWGHERVAAPAARVPGPSAGGGGRPQEFVAAASVTASW